MAYGGVVEVEFAVTDPEYPFVGLSAQEGCRVSLERMLPRGAGEFAEFFSVFGTDPDRVLELAEQSDLVEPRVIQRYEDGGLFEFLVDGFCPARDLAALGAYPREVESVDGRGRVVAEVPADADVEAFVAAFLDDHPGVELVAKRPRARQTPLLTERELARAVSEALTPRQEEVLVTAFELSYYDPSGDTTGERVGKELGISAATVSQHLQAAERKLVGMLVEDGLVDGDSGSG